VSSLVLNVSAKLHRQLATRARFKDMSLPDYLIIELQRIAETPTIEELKKRMIRRRELKLSTSPARAVRKERGR